MDRSIDLTELTLEKLVALDESEFHAVVDADLRRNARSTNVRRQDVPPWISEALRSPLAHRRALGENNQSVAKTARFRSALRAALPEAEALLGGQVQRLEQAIRAHREATEADRSIAPSQIDHALWSVLEHQTSRSS
jgi:hypothetical protein